jgi:hypothetical protein
MSRNGILRDVWSQNKGSYDNWPEKKGPQNTRSEWKNHLIEYVMRPGWERLPRIRR